MKGDAIDRWLQRASYGAALLRVLRGEPPAKVIAETQAMAERANKLREQIERVDVSEAPSSGAKHDD